VETVASFREPYKAHLARGKLEAEGIHAVVLDEHLVRLDWVLSQAIGGVKVQVAIEQLEDARKILEGDHSYELAAIEGSSLTDSPLLACPRCGADLGSIRSYSLWSLIPSLFFLLPVFFRRKVQICIRCRTRLPTAEPPGPKALS